MSERPPRPPQRVRVTRQAPDLHQAVTGSALEFSTPSLISEVLLKALVRAQARLAVGTALVVAAAIAALPIAFALFPSIARTRVLGIPLPWLILGPTVFPLFLAAGWLYERRAHRIEAEFEQLLESR